MAQKFVNINLAGQIIIMIIITIILSLLECTCMVTST